MNSQATSESLEYLIREAAAKMSEAQGEMAKERLSYRVESVIRNPDLKISFHHELFSGPSSDVRSEKYHEATKRFSDAQIERRVHRGQYKRLTGRDFDG
jgi:hypothetical protein